jgi:hypothetical protein
MLLLPASSLPGRAYQCKSQPHKLPSGARSDCICTYHRSLLRSVICSGVNSNEPLTSPFSAFETVKSSIAGPRMPFGPRRICAVVAGERSPSNVPESVSVLPDSTAVSEPDPAIRDIIVTSMGTGDSRPLNVSLFAAVWAAAANPIHRATAQSKTAASAPRFVANFINPLLCPWKLLVPAPSLRESYAGCSPGSSFACDLCSWKFSLHFGAFSRYGHKIGTDSVWD